MKKPAQAGFFYNAIWDNDPTVDLMNPLNRTEKILIGGLTVVVAAILAIFIGLSWFNYPAADDFCFAAKARDLGFFRAQAFWYEHWAGRYTLNAAWTALMMPADIIRAYRWPPVILLVLTWLGFSFFLGRAAQGQLAKPFSLLLGGVATVLFISGIPDVAQTFYWQGGSITYQLANVLLLFLAGLLIWRETTVISHRLRTLIFWTSGLLVIAIIGANEISLLLTGSIVCGGASYALWTHRDSRAFWIGLLVVALIAALISLLAPGNYERYSGIATDSMLRPAPWLAASLYLPWVALRILYWLSNLGLWLSAFILLIITFDFARSRFYVNGKFRKSLLILPALWISLIFLLSAIGFLINCYPLPERAESVIYLLFLIGWPPAFIIITHGLIGANAGFYNRRLITPALALFVVSLLGTPNVFEAYKDAYRGYRYGQEMQARIAHIQAEKQRGETDITVDSLSHPPRTLFATEIATDPSNFRNQCMSEYYQIKSIRLGAPAQR